MNALLFWCLLLVLFYLGYLFGRRRSVRAREEGAPPILAVPMELIENLKTRISPWLAISWARAFGGVIQFAGKLHDESGRAFAEIRQVLAPENVTPMLLEGEGDEVRLVLVPGKAQPEGLDRPRWWLHALLGLATLVTTTWAGALHVGVNLLEQPQLFAVGLPYSLGLMFILGAHELGHYFTALHHRIRVTPPFFIPVPFALGTFGAFIRIKSQTENRRALFDVAVAGPLAGLVFAIPALLIGLQFSRIIPADAPANLWQSGMEVGSSVLMALLARLSLGSAVMEGHRLLLHPLAFAGWLGLMVTALNLLPIGQLDGGHIAHALFGPRRAHALSVLALGALFLLALLVWPGLLMWALIVFFIAGTYDAPTADDVTPVRTGRRLIGYLAFLLLLLILLPVPPALYREIGIHGPYL